MGVGDRQIPGSLNAAFLIKKHHGGLAGVTGNHLPGPGHGDPMMGLSIPGAFRDWQFSPPVIPLI